MAEEANTDVKSTVDAETTTLDPSTEETNTSTDNSLEDELVFDFDEPDESTKDKASEEKSQEDDSKDEKTEDDSSESQDSEEKSTRAEERKQQLNSEIRDKVAERNALRKEIAELNRQKYQIKNESDLPTVEKLQEQVNPETGDYYTRVEAELERIKAERALEHEQRQMDEYTESIIDNQLRLQDEANRVLKDFPMFDEESPEYNEPLAKRAEEIAKGLLRFDDKTKQIIGSSGSVYQVYAAIAEAAKTGETNGKIAGRKAAVEMANNADTGSFSKAPAPKDDFGDAFLSGLLS